MKDAISDQPGGATPLDDISGLLRDDIATRSELNEAEGLNILNAVEWIERGRLGDLFTIAFYLKLHERMFDQVWDWAGKLRSQTGAATNIGVSPGIVGNKLGEVAMTYSRQSNERKAFDLLSFVARYHHALVLVHPFNNGNGRWARLACDAVVQRLAKQPRIVWANQTIDTDGSERTSYIDALKAADCGDFDPLETYLRDHNPHH